jgi:hypothetical protein
MQKLTITANELLQIHKIACSTWQTKIAEYLLKIDSNQNITFKQKEVDEMFKASTSAQELTLIEIFGEPKKAIKFEDLFQNQKLKLNIPHHNFNVNEYCYLISKNSKYYTNDRGDGFKRDGDLVATEVFQNGKIFTYFHDKDNTSFIVEVEHYEI